MTNITEANVSCPVKALADLHGESLRIYLLLKAFLQHGGNQVVTVKQLSQYLLREEDQIRCDLLELTLKGWIEIPLYLISDLFDDSKLENVPWQIKALAIPRDSVDNIYWQSLIDDLEEISAIKKSRYSHLRWRFLNLLQTAKAMRQEFV